MTSKDRYVTFLGIDCDRQAAELFAHIESYPERETTLPKWADYLRMKIEQKTRMGHDALFFIGAQTNALYDCFNQHDDVDAIRMLEQIEHECC